MLATAAGQAVIPFLLTRNAVSPLLSNVCLLSPASYALVTWYPIGLLSLAYGIYQAIPARINRELHFVLSRGLVVVYVSFVAWLVLVYLEWQLFSMFFFVVMLAVLTLLFERVLRERSSLGRLEQVLVLGQIALYSGWVTVLVFSNAAVWLSSHGWPENGPAGWLWQALLLLGLCWHNEYWLTRFNGDIVYGCMLLWTLGGIVVRLQHYNDTLLQVMIILAGMTLVLTHLLFRSPVYRLVAGRRSQAGHTDHGFRFQGPHLAEKSTRNKRVDPIT